MPNFYEFFREGFPNVSIESIEQGITNKEIEFTMYVELEDLNELKKLAIKTEVHEQWSIPLDKEKLNAEGKVRLRLIDNIRPTMCVKVTKEQEVGVDETEQIISMDFFKSLKELAVEGYIKTRYSIPSNIPGLIWEVDVFYGNGGAQHPWVKVDLEVKNLNDPIPMFPLKHSRVIYQDAEMSYTDTQKVNSLWRDEWQKMDIPKKQI